MGRRAATALLCLLSLVPGAEVRAQAPREGEVRQVVTFSFLPGQAAAAQTVFLDRALPLYEANDAMVSFRGFREVESPVPLDLIAVSVFRGMAGMDLSNARLRALAEQADTSIGAIYGAIAALSSGHTDEFVAMLPAAGSGDPSGRRLTAFVRYQLTPGSGTAFERALIERIVPLEAAAGVPAATGRFLVSDGWHYLRLIGFDSLGAFEDYWTRVLAPEQDALALLTERRSEIIVAAVPTLSVR